MAIMKNGVAVVIVKLFTLCASIFVTDHPHTIKLTRAIVDHPISPSNSKAGIEDLQTGMRNTRNQDCNDKVIPSIGNEVLKCFGTQPVAGIEDLQTSMCKTQNQDKVIPSFSNEVRKSFAAQPAAGTKGLADILAHKSANRLISFNRGGYLSQEPYLYTTKRFFSAKSDALKNAFPCTICFESYNSASRLTGHYLKSHDDLFDYKKEESYEKCKCGALFLHRSDYAEHKNNLTAEGELIREHGKCVLYHFESIAQYTLRRIKERKGGGD